MGYGSTARTARPSARIASRALAAGRVASKATGDALARLAADGRPILVLNGSPWWAPPEHVRAAAAEAMAATSVAHSQGEPALRRAFAARLARDHGFEPDPEREVLVTNAGMHALNVAFRTLLDPGDEVVMPSPIFYFDGAIRLAGGVPVRAPTDQADGWRWDVAALERAITDRTKLLLINSPTNPTGHVATADDLAAVAEVARRHDLLVLSDEAYDRMLYDGAAHRSFAAQPGVRDRTLTVYSLTKSYAMRPWRVGCLVAPDWLTPHLRAVLEWDVLAVGHVAQAAARAALEGPSDWVSAIAGRFQRGRDLIVDGLRGAPGLSFAVPRGGPFLFLRAPDGFGRVLLEEHGVPTDPGQAFGAPEHLRLAFGAEDEVVVEAASRIRAAAVRSC